MFRFMITASLLVPNAATIGPQYLPQKHSAASSSQIKFAIENKYDDTGPGAKEPEYAYKIYKTLDEALVAYLDDPDTKLPEHEIAKTLQILVKPNEYYEHNNKYSELKRYYPKTVEEYTSTKQMVDVNDDNTETKPILVTRHKFPDKKLFYHDRTAQLGVLDLRGVDEVNIRNKVENVHAVKLKPSELYKVSKIFPVKNNPISLAHFRREPENHANEEISQFDPNPKYTFSYGVHDKKTGDSKSAHETRDGDTVRGYYTFMDADGKQRTVHYTADEKSGFRATVERRQTNGQ